MEVVASLSQGRTAAAQCGLFTYKSVPVIFEPPCICIYFIYSLLALLVHSPCVYDVQLNNARHCSGLHYKVVTVFREPLSSLYNSSVPGDRFFFMHVKSAKVT